MMDVLFVNAPNVRWTHGHIRFGCRSGSRWPWTSVDNPTDYAPFPFFMAHATSYLKSKGVNAGLYDAVVRREFDYGPAIEYIIGRKPTIVVIETSTPTIDIDLIMARRCALFSEVALSGPHATIFAEELSKLSYISYVLKGEYELSSYDMWSSRRKGVYECCPVEDIDTAPYPYRDPEVINNYWDPSPIPIPRPQLQVYASRGCPYQCTYCMWPSVMYAKTFRPRNPLSVAAEIKFCLERFNSKSIFFDDDTFNIGTERISSLCDELQVIGLPWTMMGRLDTSPKWLFDKMVDSGCAGMRFGVETFCAHIQKRIKKMLDVDKAINMLEYLKVKHPHLPIHITTMCNLPGETSQDRDFSNAIVEKLGFDNSGRIHNHQLSSCVPFPGTDLYKQLDSMGFGKQLLDFYAYDGSQSNESEISKAIVSLGRNAREYTH
ncbi:MAG: radical SAM protein [Alphaproteobacteria bacterium]|nr:radical SAM protein [Alphaproteobacteria bacterium]